jgi:hypothetical protein
VVLGRPPPVQRCFRHGGPLGYLINVQARITAGEQEIAGHVQHPLVNSGVTGAATAGRFALARHGLLLKNAIRGA